MLREKIIYACVAGEVAPDFYGRTDIQKYDFGMKKVLNFLVDYRGGLKSRGGFRMCAPVQLNAAASAHRARLFRFEATGDDYLLEFGPGYMRPLRNGGYLIEAAKTLVSVSGDTFAVTAHGYSNDDLIFVSGTAGDFAGRYFEVYGVTTNTFDVREVDTTSLDTTGYTAYLSGGTVARVVTTTTPYTADDLADLRLEQRYEECTLTHISRPPAKITRVSDVSWTYEVLDLSDRIATPTGLAAAASAAGSASVAWAVTAVADGEESLPSAHSFATSIVNYTATAGSLRMSWSPVEGAEEYRLYRSLVLPGSDISHSQPLAYIGRTRGTQFVDNNITPDFTKSPPEFFDPFAPAQILEVRVTAGGTGYSNTSIVTVTDADGSGFFGVPVVSPAGALLSIIVINGGSGYTSPSVSVSGGTGATFAVELGPTSGIYPSLFKIFQQRGVYAGTEVDPMRIWASRPGAIDNFDLSAVINAGDAYSYQLDSREVRPIRHLIALRSGLLVFTSKTIVQLRAEEGRAISGVNALAEPQAYKGVNAAPPIAINLDVLFAQENGASVNAMMYTEYTNTFQLQDVAVLSSHLLGRDREITRLEWQAEPHKLVWCLREDGMLLSLTYERDQDVFGWAQHRTQGYFRDICVVLEDRREILYAIVERYLNGQWRKFIERLEPRDVRHVEDYFGVDCGLSTTPVYYTSTLTVTEVNDAGDVTLECDGEFTSIAVGDQVFFGNGRYEITSVTSANLASASVVRSAEDRVYLSNRVRYFLAGEWYSLPMVEEVTSLWHLEGETLSVLADGDAATDYVVANGAIALRAPAAKVHAGLAYYCDGETLPPVFPDLGIEARLKDIPEAAVRLKDTRGLAVGADENSLIEMKDRTDEAYGEVLKLRSDFATVAIDANWSTDGTIFFRQAYPLPAHVLSFTLTVDVGD